ncbi:cytochrome P450 [Brevibacillus dissolubilis]|uniref:cytochrome P450 n=1 Tax=Brevibacillus dissolubilis TaxID=1844116 RepID=UPI001117640B|nr:cytochrome P450 [Brevibacillus dissolubilis]
MQKQIDISDPMILSNEAFNTNPYPVYREFLNQGEIHRLNIFGGIWFIGGYEGCAKYISDPRISHNTAQAYWAIQFSEQQLFGISEFIRVFSMWMALQDGPAHLKYRSILTQAFQQSLKGIAPYIKQVANELLDKVEKQGHMDIINDYAYPLPTRVIMKMLGIPEEKYPEIALCADSLVKVFGSMDVTYEQVTEAQNRLIMLTTYLSEIIEQRKQQPQDDFITKLLNVEDENGTKLTVDEIYAQCTNLLFGGHETTRNLIGNGLWSLFSHPQEFDKLRNQPTLMRSAIQEMLRFESPAQITVRAALDDLEMFGQQIKKGELIMFCFGSANRDPRKFTNPDEFQIERNEARNMAFGIGVHSCIGAQLAFMEAEVAISTLIARFPNVKPVKDKAVWQGNAGFRGQTELQVTW